MAEDRAVVGMPLWQRVLITVMAMLALSIFAGLAWRGLFNTNMPSYLAGMVGGVAAVLVWELLRWFQKR